MKTRVERVAAAYARKRTDMANAKETNKEGLYISVSAFRNALGVSANHPLVSWGNPWAERNGVIHKTKYSRKRDRYRAMRRNDFRTAAALDADSV